uniref:Tetratricopeptide repeat protein n=1 Tax=Jahnella sp. MSr9139 TaxID=1434086 RepID=A0A4Y5T0Z1_9BACT|nr:hypothetical protein [Jahnella sp. MSr9139]
MPRFLRSLPARIGAAIVAALMGLIGFIPLFGGPGYESALAAGLLVPGAAAIVTALEIARHRPDPPEALARGVANGAALAAIAYLTTLAHGIRVGFCDGVGGSTLFALGPGVGAVLGGAWGAAAGEIAAGRKRRRLFATLAALGGPLASIAVSIVRFVTSPMIFAYDPFVGYFSGTLYDTIVEHAGLYTYRLGSAATLLAAAVMALHLGRDELGRPAYRAAGRPGLLLLGGVALIASFAAITRGDQLGHWHTAGSIAAELGARAEGARCDVIYPRALPAEDARRFARDCDGHVAASERWLGAPALVDGQPMRVRAYLFESAEQKAALMGAARTYIAKPWRREVYLQVDDYPHPALGHEIMHVVAGAFGRGPFRIAGRLGGILPDPGLIEGIAVAGAPREGDLTPREWAKAMKDLGILPRLGRLFALGFLAENSSTAYTVSGAFVAHVRERHGAEAVRAWYGGRPLPEITGASWEEMERAWHAELDAIALPEAARVQAEARFDKPAIFGRRCPRVVDACRREAERLRARGDLAGAIEQYRRIVELDQSPAVRLEADILRVSAEAAGVVPPSGAPFAAGIAPPEGHVAGESPEDPALPGVPRHVRDKAVEVRADRALVAGDGERAAAGYQEVASRVVDEDKLRTLDVKIAAAGDERARQAITELLIGTAGRGPDPVRAAELLGAWAATAPTDGLPMYLLARRYVGEGRFAEAAERLDHALAAEITLPRVRTEAERLRLVVACGLGDSATAGRMLEAYVARGVSEARREAARRLLERCSAAP